VTRDAVAATKSSSSRGQTGPCELLSLWQLSTIFRIHRALLAEHVYCSFTANDLDEMAGRIKEEIVRVSYDRGP
jgi:hypothetical protein